MGGCLHLSHKKDIHFRLRLNLGHRFKNQPRNDQDAWLVRKLLSSATTIPQRRAQARHRFSLEVLLPSRRRSDSGSALIRRRMALAEGSARPALRQRPRTSVIIFAAARSGRLPRCCGAASPRSRPRCACRHGHPRSGLAARRSARHLPRVTGAAGTMATMCARSSHRARQERCWRGCILVLSFLTGFLAVQSHSHRCDPVIALLGTGAGRGVARLMMDKRSAVRSSIHQPLHPGCERVECEGLGHDLHARLQRAVADDDAVGIAGHEQHLEVRPPLP